jgi:hypothetical protein
MTTTLQDVDFTAADAEVPVNENFDSLSAAGIFSKRHAATSGLTWAYYGGRYNGNTIADGTVTLTNTATNYVVVHRSTGVVSVSTSNTNYNNTSTYSRLYQLTVAGGVVTVIVDGRMDTGGLLNGGTTSTDYRNTATAVTNSAGTVTLDWALGDYFTHTATANITTLAFSNLPGSGKGASLMLRFTQDSTPRTFAWPASFKWAGGVAPSVSTGSGVIDVLSITTFDNGTSWQATLTKAFA